MYTLNGIEGPGEGIRGMGSPAVVSGTDADLGEALVRLGRLAPEQLQEAVRFQEEAAKSSGRKPWLGQVLLDKGFVPDRDALKSAGLETSALMRCPGCDTSCQVWYHNPAGSYPCPSCGQTLEPAGGAGADSPQAALHRKIRQRTNLLYGLIAALGLSIVGLVVLAARPNRARPIIQRCQEDLEDKDWEALEEDLKALEKVAPKHPAVATYRARLDQRRADLDRRRREWQGLLSAMKTQSLADALRGLRPRFQDCPDLQVEFKEGLLKAFGELEQACVREGQTLAGDGRPRPEWLSEDLRKNARLLQDRARAMAALQADPEFPYKVGPGLAELPDRLQKILDYRGTWDLCASVAPFAEVIVRSGSKEIARDWTPVVLRGLEIGGGTLQVDLACPSAQDARLRHTVDLPSLRHGQRVVIGGDLELNRIDVRR